MDIKTACILVVYLAAHVVCAVIAARKIQHIEQKAYEVTKARKGN